MLDRAQLAKPSSCGRRRSNGRQNGLSKRHACLIVHRIHVAGGCDGDGHLHRFPRRNRSGPIELESAVRRDTECDGLRNSHLLAIGVNPEHSRAAAPVLCTSAVKVTDWPK